jgi:polysaccharide pyruvyl transferase WcaK-like protein
MKNILIFGHYGVPNWGDEAILQGLLSKLNIQENNITVVTNNLEFTRKRYLVNVVYPPPFGIRSFFRGGFFKTLSAIKHADYIIFGGGGLWQSHPLKSLYIWDWYLRICLLFNNNIYSLGTSFSNIDKKYISEGMKVRLQNIKIFLVRDKKSLNVLQDLWGVNNNKIEISTDLALLLKPKNNFRKNKTILFSMREGDLSLEKEIIILEVFRIKFPNHKFKVLVMQSNQSKDENFAKRHSLEVIKINSVDDIQNNISMSNFVCSSRLHSNILALNESIPFLAIACRHKIKNFFGELFSFNPNYLNKNNSKIILSNKINSIVLNSEKKRKLLHNKKDLLNKYNLFSKSF